MSYILQALKKSEQERELATQETIVLVKQPNIASAQEQQAVGERLEDPSERQGIIMTPWSRYLGVGAFALILLLLFGYLQQPRIQQEIKEAAVVKPVVAKPVVAKPVVAIKETAVVKPAVISPVIPAGQASISTQSLIPNLDISSHIYSSLPNRRSIVINGERLVEADFITPRIRIKEITHHGMVIEVDGSPLLIDRSRGWSR